SLGIDRTKFHGDVSDLLWLVLTLDGELNIVTLTHAPEHIDFLMVTSDQSAQFAPCHLQIVLRALEVRLDVIDAAIHGVEIIRVGLGGELILYICIDLRQLLRVLFLNLNLFIARFLQIALGYAQSLLHDSQIALQSGTRGVSLRQLLFESDDLLAIIFGDRLNLAAKGLLRLLQLRRVVPS